MNRRATKDPKRLALLSLGALGVVYGDIGTSPLYALKEVFGGTHHPVPISEHNVLGILSLVFWALMLVVTIKYVIFIMRADNKGEGGIMALMALVVHAQPDARRARILMLLGLGRRRAVLWRRNDHAGGFRAVRDRGPRSRHARVQALRHSASRCSC